MDYYCTAVLIDDGKQVVAPQYGVESHATLQLRALSPGGGGWGDPHHRDPMRVLRDARDGILSKEAAESVYAVAIGADGRSIDAEATRRLRESHNSTDS